MASVKAFTLKGKVIKERVTLPSHFDTPYRPDVIKRAVLAVQSRRRQPHGVDAGAEHAVLGNSQAILRLGRGDGVAVQPGGEQRRVQSSAELLPIDPSRH